MLVLTVACGGNKAGVPASEDAPAPPCSVNGMLFRDTPDTKFEQCGTASPPFDGEVLECMRKAMLEPRPFVVAIETPTLVPASRGPALVGAHFDGEFALRMYSFVDEGVGERSPVELMLMSSEVDEVSLNMPLDQARRCTMTEQRPDPAAANWVDVNGDGKWLFDGTGCAEWFDGRAWKEQPWSVRHDASAQMRCEGR